MAERARSRVTVNGAAQRGRVEAAQDARRLPARGLPASPARTSAASTACAARARCCSTARPCGSCLMFAVQADGAERHDDRGPRRRRRRAQRPCSRRSRSHGLQCGFCTPGFVVSVTAFLARQPGSRPTTRSATALSGNLCRCTGYQGIIDAVRLAAAASAASDGDAVPHRVDRRQSLRRPARPAPRGRAARSPATAATSTTSSCPGMLHAAFVRSDIARGTHHARSTSSAARDLRRRRRRVHRRDLNGAVDAAAGRLRGPGGADRRRSAPGRAATCASSASRSRSSSPSRRYIAEDACELVEVDIEPLTAGRRRRRAPLDDDAPLVHPELGSNVAGVDARRRPIPSSTQIFASAAHVVTETFPAPLHAACRWRPAASSSTGSRATGELDVWISTQNPHEVRGFLARVRSASPSTGSASSWATSAAASARRCFMLHEELAVVLAAQAPRPAGEVDRGPAREPHVAASTRATTRMTVSFAVDADGRILGAHARPLEDVGAFPAGRRQRHRLRRHAVPGPVPDPEGRLLGARVVYTNTCGPVPYRGPWMFETRRARADDGRRRPRRASTRSSCAAATSSHDDDLPYTTADRLASTTGSIAERDARAGRGDDRLRRRSAPSRRAARAEGRLLGIGLGLYVEPTGIAWAAWPARPRPSASSVDGQVAGAHEQRQPRPEPRDDDGPGRRRPARRRLRRRHRRPGRHRRDAVRARHRRQPQRRASSAARPREAAAQVRDQGARRSPPTSLEAAPEDLEIADGADLGRAARRAQGVVDRRGRPRRLHSTRPSLPPGMRDRASRRTAPLHAGAADHVVERVPRLHRARSTRHRRGRRSCATSSARTAA